LPDPSVVAVVFEVPVRFIVTPLATAPETVPEMEYVGGGGAVVGSTSTIARL
jgi:hypothetical protein